MITPNYYCYGYCKIISPSTPIELCQVSAEAYNMCSCGLACVCISEPEL